MWKLCAKLFAFDESQTIFNFRIFQRVLRAPFPQRSRVLNHLVQLLIIPTPLQHNLNQTETSESGIPACVCSVFDDLKRGWHANAGPPLPFFFLYKPHNALKPETKAPQDSFAKHKHKLHYIWFRILSALIWRFDINPKQFISLRVN